MSEYSEAPAIVSAPSNAAARIGTMEKAKIPSDASFKSRIQLYLLSPA